MEITYRFYSHADAEQTNQLAHAAFEIAPFPPETWQKMEEQHHATVLAEKGQQIVGAIPFDLRDFLIRPGLSLKTAFAHMVCVDEHHRSRGVGSGMMRFARENLPTFSEAMFVYTGSEGVAPYTFYQKNKFIDLHYSRFHQLDHPSGELPSGLQVQPFIPEQIGEGVLNACYQQAYADYAGFPVHTPGYWREMMEGIIFAEIPTEFQIATEYHGGDLAGYALLGFANHSCTILELACASSSQTGIARLIQAAACTAGQRGCKDLRMLASTHHPATPVLTDLGFQTISREDAMVTAGMVFQFEAVWQKLCANRPPFGLSIWTPTRRLELTGPGAPVHLEMKDTILERLFLCRESFAAAWEAETITSSSTRLPVSVLTDLFQSCRWVYHWFEWI